MRLARAVFSIIGSAVLLLTLVLVFAPGRASAQQLAPAAGTYIVLSNQATPQTLKAHGHKVKQDLSKAGIMVVETTNAADLIKTYGAGNVAHDRKLFSAPKIEIKQVKTANNKSSGCASVNTSCGYQWDLSRIHLPEAWKTTQGSSKVRVAVVDTGLLSTHEEVGSNYNKKLSRSFVQPKNGFCFADDTTYNSTEDFYGHGTWTATHVAGVNGRLMTGIAPRTELVNIRVLGACGYGDFSWILNGMLYGNQIGARIESISLGGYLCADGVVPGSYYCGTQAAVGDDPATWKIMQQAIDYMRQHGTLVIASAGNEHVRLDKNGRVTNMGTLGYGPSPANDLRGFREVPAGLSGVIAVAATNRVNAKGASGDTIYGQFGVGKRDQLAYYSNYGPRIDVSAPGGSINYNINDYDCLVSNCYRMGPSTGATTDNPGDFGAWSRDLGGNPCNYCYVFIEGTSMATPQVAGVGALALAVYPKLSTNQLADLLKKAVTGFRDKNVTPAVTTDPNKNTYNFDLDYTGPGISNKEMGPGIIDAAKAVKFFKKK